MSFDFTQDNEVFIDLFGNCDVVVTLSGAQTAAFRAIIDQHYDVVSPYESNTSLAKSVLTLLSTDAAAITSGHVIQVKRDTETVAADYKYDGKPQSVGAGFTQIHVGLKK